MLKSTKIESGFKRINVALITFAVMMGIVLLILSWFYSGKISDKFLFYFGLPLLGIATILVIVIEIPKVKRIRLSEKGIEVENLFFGGLKNFHYTELDGYKIQFQATSYDVYKSILLYKKGKLAHEISEFYILNIREIEDYLKTNIDYLGVEKFKTFKYILTRLGKK